MEDVKAVCPDLYEQHIKPWMPDDDDEVRAVACRMGQTIQLNINRTLLRIAKEHDDGKLS